MASSGTRVIHVNEMGRYPDAVYIGRKNARFGLAKSKWSNNHTIKNRRDPVERAKVIEQYRILYTIKGRHRLIDLPELRGKPLACWCRHDGEPLTERNACHGDVLVDLLDRYTDEELREMAQ